MPETIIFRNNEVLVTPTMVTISGVTYPLITISSIRVQKHRRSKILMFFSVLLLLLGILLSIGSAMQSDVKFLIFGIILLVVSLRYLFSSQPYHLIITNASGEGIALTTKEKDYVDKVRSQIERAIAGRKDSEFRV